MQRLVFLIFLLCSQASFAQDLSDAQVELHPAYPKDGPFVLELHGIWSGNCNPGAATPEITVFDGGTLEIDLHMEPQTCISDMPLSYRLLVDVSGAFEGDETYDGNLDLTIHFFNETLSTSLALECPPSDSCPDDDEAIWPESGLWQADDLAKQGLLLARQDNRLAAYPLVYDEAGASEWLFAGGGIVADTYFSALYQASGGQCLGCAPPDEPPSLQPVGSVTMVFDSAGALQMKIDDGAFVEYRPLNFGHAWLGALPDLSGTWAVLDSQPASAPDGTVTLASVLPGVFEIHYLEELPPPIIVTPPPAGVRFAVRDLEHQVLADLNCETVEPFRCLLAVPGNDNAEFLFDASLQSPDRLLLETRSPLPEGVTPPTGIIVRATP